MSKNQELRIIVMPDGSLQTEWNGAEKSRRKLNAGSLALQDDFFHHFASDESKGLFFLGCSDPALQLSPSLGFWRSFAGTFVRRLCRTADLETLRHKVRISLEEEDIRHFLENAPLMTGAEYLGAAVLESVWEGLHRAVAEEIRAWKGTMEELIQSFRADLHLAGRIYFHLVENKEGEQPFAFLATYSARLDRQGKSKHMPLRHALQEYGKDSDKLLQLLATVHRAAGKSPLISEILESGEIFHPLAWTSGEAFTFLQEVPMYEASGILCRIPDWWKGRGVWPRLQISVGDKQPSYVGMDAILNFNPRIFLGDVELTEAEARKLLAESDGLAFIKNRWVAADPEKLKQTLAAYEKAKQLMKEEGISLREAILLQLQPEKYLTADADEDMLGISNGQWLASVFRRLTVQEDLPPVDPGKNFTARLRPYQQKGLEWLHFHHSLRFGACLADDMGLGKTVQLLGFLSVLQSESNGGGGKKAKGKAKEGKPKASLLILPASLISNWVNEIGRFAPKLRYHVAHPSAHRCADDVKTGNPNDFDLLITTYALVQKYEWMQRHTWKYVILDEAQAIKNPGTKQTRAVKKLTAENRIIMTGTPVENRLGDLWSLFDFLNPGLLGTSKEFSSFVKKTKEDSSGYSRLRKIISPYILRRLKTDKKVISDLPEKVEMKTYAGLSKKQTVLYTGLVNDIRRLIEDSEGIQRKGLILASLMKFKQICNHPDQYLGTGDYGEKDSGKFSRLREICETIYEKREKALVFTQFKEMTEPLAAFLSGIFKREGLILHGSVAIGKRKKIIEKFQDRDYVPFMVLSLKAGGVGLNLTEANHVIHFDRWWNPAVENQATDRAFRIGQKKNVMVHKFLTSGTVEEKIDRMLEEKRKLSDEVVASTGEKWVTEMESDELMDLFRLSL
ncbi:MAG: DEAD/DEAH box helicase [Desulfococcaceae bacterium]|jgi:non-specific serine/threonine protein kinase|nr:DEAD/DEAH box helicase [Desulfococcaceae bacterium]